MAIVKGYVFGATESVTNAKLHALVDNATISGLTNSSIAADASIDSSKVAFDLASYVALAGTQTITGDKTFSGSVNFTGTTNAGTPIGGYIGWLTNTAPTGWLICDGSAVSRTTYAALFGVISTLYGVGDNSTTFNLPNLKGRIGVGRDAAQTEFDVLGETGGAKEITLTAAQSGVPAHSHIERAWLNLGGSSRGMAKGGENTTGDEEQNNTTSNNTPANASEAHNNLQPYIVTNYIIRHA